MLQKFVVFWPFLVPTTRYILPQGTFEQLSTELTQTSTSLVVEAWIVQKKLLRSLTLLAEAKGR